MNQITTVALRTAPNLNTMAAGMITNVLVFLHSFARNNLKGINPRKKTTTTTTKKKPSTPAFSDAAALNVYCLFLRKAVAISKSFLEVSSVNLRDVVIIIIFSI